jgi:hypothetical protein
MLYAINFFGKMVVERSGNGAETTLGYSSKKALFSSDFDSLA